MNKEEVVKALLRYKQCPRKYLLDNNIIDYLINILNVKLECKESEKIEYPDIECSAYF